ncbi:hypothetical protein [Actinomycetospora termitidis]|uniref:DUF5709 domain-containing protein n=1 Tax=Actinomycetospora termitidis TaxID=3053470 RepID=A0ABT7M8X7_9PSEU|nr:hypothetical protein [Actinomycetospora sp. Odt1-22]MDL5157129.1 hypothetical protein [Actinomycetospora sp. Odt1-22]
MSEQYLDQAEAIVDNDTSALDSEPSLVLDEDRIGADPLEDGMDTAEDYSRDVKLGGNDTADDRDTIAYRLPQEEPDVVEELEEPPGRPIAATPAMDLDESVDDPENAVDGVGDLGTTAAPVADPLDPDGAVEAQLEGEIQVSAGADEETGLPADDATGEAAAVGNEWPTEGAEQQALHVDQES